MTNESFLVLETSRPASVLEGMPIDVHSIPAQEPQQKAWRPPNKPAGKVSQHLFRLSMAFQVLQVTLVLLRRLAVGWRFLARCGAE
jgi:hypothetical protein